MPNTKEELAVILAKLDEENLFVLAKTITQGLKRSDNKEEAIYNIIRYSPDEISILRRKLVTKEILFNYLDDKNIKVVLPTTKYLLIDKVAEIWNISKIGVHNHEDEINESSALQLKDTNDSGTGVNDMARQFAKWFYNMLNSGECGSEHFFPDTRFKLNMYSNDDCHTNTIENNPDEIAEFLVDTCQQNKLYLNPNETKEGLQGRVDPHGLVLILACGTLHTNNICVGVFEQMFALARDPQSDNNWKIRNTEINLRSKHQVINSPRLCDNELTSKLLMLPSE